MANYTIDIYANNRASRALDGIERQLSSINRTGRAVIATLAGVATGRVARGIADQYSAYERYNTVLRTYLGSQAAANAEMSRLRSLANSLPQDLDDVTNAFTIFTRSGLNTSSEALTAFSNIATANGKSLTQLGEAVADALTGEFERLKEFGIKVSKENDQFVARIGDQQVAVANSSTDLVRQLQSLGEVGGRFGGAAAANANTLNQSFSNLQGAIFSTSITIMENLKPALQDAVNLTTDWLNSHQELIAALSGKVGEALLTSIHAIANGLTIISENMAVVRASLVSFLGVKIFGDFQQIIQRVTRDTNSVSQTLRAVSTDAARMGVAFEAAGAKSITTTTMLGKLGKLFKDFVREIPLIGGALTSLGGIMARLGPMLLNPWIGIPVAIGAAVAGGIYYFQDSMIDLGSTSASVGEIVAASWWALTEIFTGVSQWLVDKMSYAFNTIAGGLGTVYNYFSERFSGILSTVKSVVNIMIGVVWGFFQTIWNNLQNLPAFFAQSFSSALTVIGAFATAAGNQIGEVWDYIKSGGEDAIANTFTGLGDTISAEVSKIGSTITPIDWNATLGTDYIGESASYVSDTVATMVTEITGNVQSATANLVENYRAHVAEAEAAARATEYYDDHILRLARSTNTAADSETSLAAATDTATDSLRNQSRALDETEAKARTVSGIITETWKDMSESMSRGISESIMAGKGAFRSFSEYLKNWANEVVTRIIDRLLITPMLDQLANWGSQLIGGFSGMGGGAAATGGAGGGLGGLLGGLFGGGAGGGLFGGIGNFFSGLWGGVSSFFGNIFGGFFADGGYLPAGKVGIVGEAGPELISGPANITPMTSGGGEGLTVNFNINSIDSQSGTQFILDHKKEIEGVIQNAYNRRGKEGIY